MRETFNTALFTNTELLTCVSEDSQIQCSARGRLGYEGRKGVVCNKKPCQHFVVVTNKMESLTKLQNNE